MTHLLDINAQGILALSTIKASSLSGQERISEDMGLFAYFSLGCLMAGLSITGVETACCPMEWLPFKGHCYKLFTNKVTWPDAVISCQNLLPGCHLASIHSNREAAEVSKYVSKYSPDNADVWIGLRDPRKNQQWRWIDDSPVNYLAWNHGEPSKDGNCVDLWAAAGYMRWNDLNCAHLRPYLCKFRL